MAIGTAFSATTSTGETFTRMSRTCVYTHAIQATSPYDGRVVIYSWHKTESAAVKALTRESKRNGWTGQQIRPVTTK